MRGYEVTNMPSKCINHINEPGWNGKENRKAVETQRRLHSDLKATNRIPDLDGVKEMFDKLNILARSAIVEKL